jgi:hypothetical protein
LLGGNLAARRQAERRLFGLLDSLAVSKTEFKNAIVCIDLYLTHIALAILWKTFCGKRLGTGLAIRAQSAIACFVGDSALRVEPGAEKILLLTRTCPVLALESNGLRVLLRLGFGEEKKSYSTTYRLLQNAAGDGLDKDHHWLIQAHLLLRLHGQELCRRAEPMCDKCPLAADCEYYQRGDA